LPLLDKKAQPSLNILVQVRQPQAQAKHIYFIVTGQMLLSEFRTSPKAGTYYFGNVYIPRGMRIIYIYLLMPVGLHF
jgi:hypothetical protein